MGCFVVTEFLLTTASRGHFAIAELLVFRKKHQRIVTSQKLVLHRSQEWAFSVVCDRRWPTKEWKVDKPQITIFQNVGQHLQEGIEDQSSFCLWKNERPEKNFCFNS